MKVYLYRTETYKEKFLFFDIFLALPSSEKTLFMRRYDKIKVEWREENWQIGLF